MRKYKWAAAGVFILALLGIVALHSYFNLMERISPPSEMWGRDKLIGVTTFNKEPVTAYDGKDINVIYAENQSFKRAIIDNNGVLKETREFGINGYDPEKLMKYQGNSNCLLMLEDFNLYYIDIRENKAVMDRKKLLSGILGFELLQSGENNYVAAYDKAAITIYELKDGALSKLSDALPANNIKYVSLKLEAGGSFHMAYIEELKSLDYNLVYQTFNPASKQWMPKIKPYIIENLSSYNLNNLQLCLDDEDAYLFYELYKTTPKGMVAQTYFTRIPKGSASGEDPVFSILNPDEEQYAGTAYISSLKCIADSNDKLQLIMTTPIKTSLKREGNELMYAVMDKGKIIEKQIASNTGQWNNDVMFSKYGGQYFAFFMQTMGRAQYEIRMTSSGEQYKLTANKITREDISSAVRDTLSGYIFALLPIFIGLLIMVPALLWPIAVDFFEWKRFYYNENLTFNVGAAIELIFMFFNISIIYANSDALQYMPGILKFAGAKYLYLLLTFAIAYAISWLNRKSKKEAHIFVQMLSFVIIHLILIYFLFAKYIAGF